MMNQVKWIDWGTTSSTSSGVPYTMTIGTTTTIDTTTNNGAWQIVWQNPATTISTPITYTLWPESNQHLKFKKMEEEFLKLDE